MARALSSYWSPIIVAAFAVAIVALALGIPALVISLNPRIPSLLRVTEVETSNLTLAADVFVIGDLTVTGQITSAPAPIVGWLGFWWTDTNFGYKHSWARFDPLLGLKIGNNIPYSPSEARASSIFKSQFKVGAEPNSIAFMMRADRSGINYLVRHSMALHTYNKTVLGTPPTNHGLPEILFYDTVNARYIGMATITSQSSKYGVVIIDPDTGAITPLTGAAGTLPPTNNFGLDMQIIGNRIYYFERYDDDSNKGLINWYDRDNGQYLGRSFFNGSFVAYPGTFVPTVWTDSLVYLWYQSVGYDASNARLHVVLGEVGGGYDRHMAWIQGTDEADLMAKLESGNYDLHLAQNQPAETLNGACWIDP